MGQDLSTYDDLIGGFTNLYLQPCYLENESVEWNGRNFALTEAVVKDNLLEVVPTDTQMDGID